MTTTHDTSIHWTDCPVCAGLHRELEYTSEKAQNAWRTYDSLDAEYRMAMDDGRLGFGTTAWRQWRALLDDLLHQYYAAEDAKRASIKAWGDSIREHAVIEDAIGDRDDADGAGEECVDDDDMPCMVDVHTPCACAMCQTEDGEDNHGLEEPSMAEELLYGDVPDFDLPVDFEDGSWVSLHSASVAVRVYMLLLEQYAPATAKGYPAWVANRLRDILDETAIQRAADDRGSRR